MATTKILIPTPLRPYTDKQEAVEAHGATIGELLADLTRRHSGLKAHLYNDSGQLRSFVNVYLNDEDIRYLQKDATPVATGDTVTIVPSIAGGAATLEGQKKLKQARVLLVGAGGLGAPLGLYLTAAGVGHIGIVDADVVDSSN